LQHFGAWLEPGNPQEFQVASIEVLTDNHRARDETRRHLGRLPAQQRRPAIQWRVQAVNEKKL